MNRKVRRKIKKIFKIEHRKAIDEALKAGKHYIILKNLKVSALFSPGMSRVEVNKVLNDAVNSFVKEDGLVYEMSIIIGDGLPRVLSALPMDSQDFETLVLAAAISSQFINVDDNKVGQRNDRIIKNVIKLAVEHDWHNVEWLLMKTEREQNELINRTIHSLLSKYDFLVVNEWTKTIWFRPYLRDVLREQDIYLWPAYNFVR